MVLLRALVCDRLIQNNWSEIQNIGTVQFIINQHICSETQTRAFNLTFGDLDSIYMQLPEGMDLSSAFDEYVKLLQGNLQSLRSTAAACIASKKYQRAGTLTEEIQNTYQEETSCSMMFEALRRLFSLASCRPHTKDRMSSWLSTRMISPASTPTPVWSRFSK